MGAARDGAMSTGPFYLGLLYRLREQDVAVGPTEALALAAA